MLHGGELIHGLFVRRDMRVIFALRRRKPEEFFSHCRDRKKRRSYGT